MTHDLTNFDTTNHQPTSTDRTESPEPTRTDEQAIDEPMMPIIPLGAGVAGTTAVPAPLPDAGSLDAPEDASDGPEPDQGEHDPSSGGLVDGIGDALRGLLGGGNATPETA
ncbi:MAG: hypothetical protein LH650_16270 [Chloroflexi bacterium]|nr:hypothetical protein [Chloroflexota bacterium]